MKFKPSRLRAALLSPLLFGLATAACSATPLAALSPDGAPGAIGAEASSSDTGQPSATIATSESQDESAIAREPGDWGILGDGSYHRVVDKVANMTADGQLRRMVSARGLDLLNVMWEDTGRNIGSSVGPNITDLTLQVRYRRPGQRDEQAALMPVIRFPNFSDRTGDVSADKFFVRVGNERHPDRLTSVPLTDVLSDIKRFSSKPSSLLGSGNLLAGRDSHFLVSSQAVFLPIPKEGKAEFNPVVFNYQSAPGSPAVLTLLVTRQGTSMRVIENAAEDGSIQGMGQELYFNSGGKRAAFTAERLSTVEDRIDAQGGPRTADDASALQKGADVLFLVQVPLKHRAPRRWGVMEGAPVMDAEMAMPSAAGAPSKATAKRERSDVEQAVLGHGRLRGPYVEGSGAKLERDPRFPIRITVQFYKATSNGVVEAKDLDAIARSIGNVYEHADFVGSLVLPPGDALRPTAWNRAPKGWFPF
jgi:hypothetical protein